MAEACRALDFPVVSGNVSLYNETDGKAIPPTPVVGGVGLIPDLSKTATLKGAAKGDILILVGDTTGHLGASLYARKWLGLRGDDLGPPPPVDLAIEADNAAFVRELIGDGLVTAVHDLSEGGVACAAAEMALAADIGVSVSVADIGPEDTRPTDLFCEAQGRYLLAAKAENQAEIVRRGNAAGINAGWCGQFGGDAVRFVQEQGSGKAVGEVRLADLRAAHEGWLPSYMASVV